MIGTPGSAVAAARPRLSRRRLLHASGYGAASVAAAPWLSGAVVLGQPATPIAALSASAWDDLASRLTGHLLRPGDAMYPAATIISAARYMGTRPAGIAVCVSPQDAAVCVIWAREHGVPFVVRSGGHNYAGFSTSDGLVIDVKGMRSVAVDPATRTAVVAGGANNADVGEALAPYGVYFPGGRCPTVGVSGLTLGGGWGFSCRHLGMTCDSLVSTEVVTASGDIVTASESENADLFWAVRGAGGGNFGVHTSFTFRVVPADEVCVFRLAWSGGDAAALVDAILRMQLHAPRELGLRLAVTSQSRMPLSQPAPLDVNTIGLFWGSLAELAALLAPVERVQAAEARRVEQMRFPAAREFLAATTPSGAYQVKSGFFRDALPAAGLATMLEWIGAMPGVSSRAQESTGAIFCWGGKVSDLAPDANAFVHRGADFLFKCEALWEAEDDPGLIAANLEWLEGYYAAMQPYLSGGVYQNFPDRGLIDWQDAYYGDHFSRLVETKRRWDPENLFRYGQSIPPAL